MEATMKVNRWLILIGCAMGVGTTGGAYIWNVFKNPLMKQFEWSASEVTLVYSGMIGMIFLTGLFVGKISDNKSPKKLAMVGSALYALGWILSGFVTTLPMMILCVSIIVGCGNGMLYTNLLSTALKWFPDKKGFVSEIVLASCNLVAVVFSPISNWFNSLYGPSRTLTIMGIIFGIMYVIAMFLVKDNPPAGWKPDGWEPEQEKPEFRSQKNYTRSEMLSTSMFWLMLAAFITAQCSGQLVVSSASSIDQV